MLALIKRFETCKIEAVTANYAYNQQFAHIRQSQTFNSSQLSTVNIKQRELLRNWHRVSALKCPLSKLNVFVQVKRLASSRTYSTFLIVCIELGGTGPVWIFANTFYVLVTSRIYFLRASTHSIHDRVSYCSIRSMREPVFSLQNSLLLLIALNGTCNRQQGEILYNAKEHNLKIYIVLCKHNKKAL